MRDAFHRKVEPQLTVTGQMSRHPRPAVTDVAARLLWRGGTLAEAGWLPTYGTSAARHILLLPFR